METGLEGKPWYIPAGIAAVIAIALVVTVKMTLVDGIEKKIATNQQTLKKLEEDILEGQTAQRNLPQFREEVQRLELELEKLLKILPSRRKTEDLLRRFRDLVERGDFGMRRFFPKQPRPLDDFYSEWPIDLQLDGSYHNLAMFFDRVGQFSRIINIENLKINASRSDENPSRTIQASFTAKTFLYNEPEEEDME